MTDVDLKQALATIARTCADGFKAVNERIDGLPDAYREELQKQLAPIAGLHREVDILTDRLDKHLDPATHALPRLKAL